MREPPIAAMKQAAGLLVFWADQIQKQLHSDTGVDARWEPIAVEFMKQSREASRALRSWLERAGHPVQTSAQKRRTRSGRLGRGVRHTTCRFCELDIEGIAPYRRGEWRDRGNNTHCPTPEGDAGRQHAPVKGG